MTPLRVLSLLDAAGMTGPAKNLLQLCRGARALESAEISIATICRTPAQGDSPVNPFMAAARNAGIGVDIMSERFRYDTRVLDQLRDIVDQRNPDVIETHGVRVHFLARMSGLSRKIPWLAFHHGYTAEDLKMRAYNQLDRWSLRGAARIFTDCRPFAEQLAGMGIPHDRVHVLGSSIEASTPATAQEIQAVRHQWGIEDGERVILSVGRLSREKAQGDLIAAAAHLRRTNPELRFRLVLVGDGPERRKLEQAVAVAGLSGSIVFAGQQNNVRSYYGMADMFALPSLSEGSPNVLLEAMISGVPIVSTSVGGVPETVEHERSALLVPARQPEALARQISRVLGDSALAARLAENANRIVRERFSTEHYCRTVVQAYSELCESRSIPR